MRTARGTRIAAVLPSQTEWPEFNAAVEKYRKLVQREKVEQHRLRTLEEQRQYAIAADRRAMTEQLLKSEEPTPDTSKLAKIEAEIAEVRRLLEACDEAVEEAENQLIDLVAEHKDEWVESVEPQVAEARDSYTAAIDALEESRWALAEKVALVRFLHVFADGDPRAYNVVQPPVRGLSAPHGDPYHWDKVVGALRKDAEPPEAPREVVVGGGYAPYSTLKPDEHGQMVEDEGTDLDDVARAMPRYR